MTRWIASLLVYKQACYDETASDLIIGYVTEYYTSHSYSPVHGISKTQDNLQQPALYMAWHWDICPASDVLH